MLDLNNITPDEGNDFSLIPHGTIARAILYIKPQLDGVRIPDLAQDAIFRQSAHSSAKWIECEFTIVGGEFDKRKVWHNIFFDGDKKNQNGVSGSKEIGLRTLRGIVDSAKGLSPNDVSPEANALRQIPSLEAINGMEICMKIAVEKGTNGYADKNKMMVALATNSKEYISSGQGQQPQVQPQQTQQPSTGGALPPWAQK